MSYVDWTKPIKKLAGPELRLVGTLVRSGEQEKETRIVVEHHNGIDVGNTYPVFENGYYSLLIDDHPDNVVNVHSRTLTLQITEWAVLNPDSDRSAQYMSSVKSDAERIAKEWGPRYTVVPLIGSYAVKEEEIKPIEIEVYVVYRKENGKLFNYAYFPDRYSAEFCVGDQDNLEIVHLTGRVKGA